MPLMPLAAWWMACREHRWEGVVVVQGREKGYMVTVVFGIGGGRGRHFTYMSLMPLSD